MYHSPHNTLSQYSVPVLLNVIRTSQFVFVEVVFNVLSCLYVVKFRLIMLTCAVIENLCFCIKVDILSK